MSTDGTTPQPEWDAENRQWISGDYRWDAEAGQWLPRVQQAVVPPDAATPQAVVSPDAVTQHPYATDQQYPPYAGQQAPYANASQNPYATGPQAPYDTAQQPWPAQPGPPTGSRKGLPVGAIVGIVIGGVVLLALVGLGIAALVVRAAAPSTAGPQAVVEDYFDALFAGDSAAALKLLGTTPDDTTLLTDEALAASEELGAIDDVVVTVPEGADLDSRTVDVGVDYTIGGEPVSGTFTVTDYDNDKTWEIMSGTVDIYFGAALDGLDSTINGIPFDADTITVFPGAVELATTNPNYTLSGTTTALISDPSDYMGDQLSPTVALSDTGLTAFQTSITESVNGCIASKNLVAGCGLDIPETLSDGTKVIDGTITRSLDADAQATMANLEPDEIYGDPLNVTGPYIGGVDVTADCESNGQRYTGCTFVFMPSLGSPLVDFTTDPPTVRWDG